MLNLFRRKKSLKVKRLSLTAKLPTKAYAFDAGYDLYSDTACAVYMHDKDHCVVETGIAMEIPKGWFGMIKPRSGLSAKEGVDVLAGVIDSSYTGEIKVVLSKCKDGNLVINPGDKIAQMVILPVPNFPIEEVTELSSTARGNKGFGSSGR